MFMYHKNMSHKKEDSVRKVVKNGRNSFYINIPREIVEELHIRERQKFTVKRIGKKIVIEDWKR